MDTLSFLFNYIQLPNTYNYRFTDDERLAYEITKQTNEAPELRATSIGDWQLDMNDTDAYKTVYRRGNESFIGFRETKIYDPNDIVSDLNIATSTEEANQRFNQSLKYVEAQRNNGVNIKTTGFSLGGSISRFVSSKLNTKSITFAAGTSPFVFSNDVENSKDFIITGDPVSSKLSNRKENLIIGLPRTLNPHAFKNYEQYL